MHIGIGFDTHPLITGRPLVLGGVAIPFEKGLAGHSDGDALSHAIVDALLGAANLGDKGTHFPSTDPQYKNISSLILLERTAQLLNDKGWKVVNVDATIVAQKPRLASYMQSMRSKISGSLEINENQVSVKATTTDGLGFLGRGEGIAALAVALLEEPS